MEKIRLEGKRFVNESGKQVILHGVNVLCRDAKLGHFYPDFEKAFPFLQGMGFNLLRFGIFWHGAEPEPGKIDRDYLKSRQANRQDSRGVRHLYHSGHAPGSVCPEVHRWRPRLGLPG